MTTRQQQQLDGETASARTWRWETEEITKDIIEQLQRGDVLETRGFLKPIFRFVCVSMSFSCCTRYLRTLIPYARSADA